VAKSSVKLDLGVLDALLVLGAILDEKSGELVRTHFEGIKPEIQYHALALIGRLDDAQDVSGDAIDDGTRSPDRSSNTKPGTRLEIRHPCFTECRETEARPYRIDVSFETLQRRTHTT
jgi:hypothetical protein